MTTKKNICFVGADNYPVLAKIQSGEFFGGESVQQTLLAKGFVELGYDVSMIVKDHGQQDVEVIDGITVLKGFMARGGIPVLRWLHPRLTGLVNAVKKANTDFYFSSCAGVPTGVVSHFCRKNNRRHIFRLAHDSDVIPGQQLIKFWRDRKIYEYGLKNADLISAQGVVQQELLKKNYGLESVPVNMAVEFPTDDVSIRRDIDVLWVNNLRPFKRPEKAIELARMMPEFNVHMIGGPVEHHAQFFEKMESRAKEVPNLTFHGSVPYAEVNSYFERAKVFVNTSDQEGFPNSFLQSWVRKVPVISFFDPDHLIADQGLGAVPNDLEGMARIVSDYLREPQRLDSVGQHCETYARANYAPMSVAKTYEDLLERLDQRSG